MKNKLFVFLAIIALAGITIAFHYDNAQATATAISRNGSSRALCGCRCRCPVGMGGGDCFDHQDQSDQDPSVANCACILPNPTYPTAPPCTVKAEAAAWKATPPGIPWKARVWSYDHKSTYCYSWGKNEPKTLVTTKDSLRATIFLVGNDLNLDVHGYMSIDPSGYSNLRKKFSLTVRKWDGTCLWYGDATLLGGLDPVAANHLTISGTPQQCPGWQKETFRIYLDPVGDSLWTTIDTTYTITLAKNLATGDSLEVVVNEEDENIAGTTPTMTYWGMIILVILIVGSGIFVMLKRRKVAVPA
jgi:hypothetical protein